jgi:hypothetical protein
LSKSVNKLNNIEKNSIREVVVMIIIHMQAVVGSQVCLAKEAVWVTVDMVRKPKVPQEL